MTIGIIRDGYVCTDCLIWIANGDDSGIEDPARAARVRDVGEEWVESDGHDWTAGGEDGDEGGFMWRPCDRCHDAGQGGDRHPAVILGEVEP